MYHDIATRAHRVMTHEQARKAYAFTALRHDTLNLLRLATLILLGLTLVMSSTRGDWVIYPVCLIVLWWSRPVALSQLEQEILRVGHPLSERQLLDVVILNACVTWAAVRCFGAWEPPYWLLLALPLALAGVSSWFAVKSGRALGALLRDEAK